MEIPEHVRYHFPFYFGDSKDTNHTDNQVEIRGFRHSRRPTASYAGD